MTRHSQICVKLQNYISKKTDTDLKTRHLSRRKEERVCVVPLHSELAVGTLRNILRQARITPDEFLRNA